jgi:hypothetical protein
MKRIGTHLGALALLLCWGLAAQGTESPPTSAAAAKAAASPDSPQLQAFKKAIRSFVTGSLRAGKLAPPPAAESK